MAVAKWTLFSLRLRERVATALRAYREVEARFHAIQETKEALDAEERVILYMGQ